MALSQYDQSVRDAGYKYIPQSQYLLDPFQIPQSSENEVPTGIATVPVSMGGGGGGGFNPYNADMSQIRTDFRPDYDFRRYSEYGMNPTMMNIKEMDMNQEYFYDRPSAMQQKIGGLMNFIPGIGTLKRGAEFIGGALKGILPENQRAIMENQARGKGIFTDDIGRIVTDDYNTAGGIMAGYNLNKIDADTFNKRRETINKTIADKKAKGLDTTALEERLGLLDEAEEDILGLQKRTKDIVTFREKKKAEEAAAKKAEEDARLQAEIDAYNRRQAEVARRSRDSDNDGVPDYVEDAGGSAPGGMYGTDYQGDSSPSSSGGGGGNPYGGGSGGVQSGMSSSSSPTNVGNPFGYMDGGRVAYMMGGLTDLVDIYD